MLTLGRLATPARLRLMYPLAIITAGALADTIPPRHVIATDGLAATTLATTLAAHSPGPPPRDPAAS
jgi:hypothetical protein